MWQSPAAQSTAPLPPATRQKVPRERDPLFNNDSRNYIDTSGKRCRLLKFETMPECLQSHRRCHCDSACRHRPRHWSPMQRLESLSRALKLHGSPARLEMRKPLVSMRSAVGTEPEAWPVVWKRRMVSSG